MPIENLRFAVRSLLRAPRFTVPALLTLALGMGAASAMFSVVRGVLVEPLPYREPDRLVAVWENRLDRRRPRNVVSAANFIAWVERNRSFERLGLVGPARLNVVLDGQPEEVAGFSASADALAALGTEPRIGRLFTRDEDLRGSDDVILVAHEFWQARLGGRHDVVGQSLTVSGRPRTIVGVMPAGFTIEGQKGSFLVPYGWTEEALRRAPGRGSSHGIARLKDGVTFEQAYADMRAIMADLAREAPQRNTNWSITLVPIHEQTVDEVRPALYVLSGAVLLVLLVACVNVANLQLARGTVRERELAVRTALGAGRGRLVSQLLMESLLLSCAGAAAGLALAVVFHRGLLALVADRIPVPRLDQVALDGSAVLFTLALAVVTGLAFGIAPALMASGAAGEGLREGGRHGGGPRARRALGALIVAEVALSLVLLAGAGLLGRSFVALQRTDPGMRTGGVLTARVSLAGERYRDERARGDFFTSARSRIEEVPGVDSVAAVSFLPMQGLGIGTSFHRLDRPEPLPGQLPSASVKPVTPGFFQTMGIPRMAGRDFTAADTIDAPQVAVVSRSLVAQQYPGEDPIGRRLNVSIGAAAGGMNVEVVGVVGDIAMTTLDADVQPTVYLPHTQLAVGVMSFVVRTRLDPASIAPGVAAAVRSIDAGLPLADVATMDEVVDTTLARPRAVASLLVAFAVAALALAAVGLYGVMAYLVSRRTREIGVRLALGASAPSVFRLIVGQAMRLVMVGVAIGLVAAAWLSRFLAAMLYRTGRFDPWAFAIAAVVLAGAAVLAAAAPARRGMRVAPVEALRAE